MSAGTSPKSGFAALARVVVCAVLGLAAGSHGMSQQPASSPPASSGQQSHEAGPPRRIPRQQALTTAALDGTVREQISDSAMRPVVGARIQIRNLQTGQVNTTLTTGEGVFRLLLLPPGGYEFRAEAEGYEPLAITSLSLNANEVVTLEIKLVPNGLAKPRSPLPQQPDLGAPLPAEATATIGAYREFRHRLD